MNEKKQCCIEVTQDGKTDTYTRYGDFKEALSGYTHARIVFKMVEAIPDKTCYRCPGVYEVELGKGVDQIGNNCFSECKNLRTAIFNTQIETVGLGSFCGLKQFTSKTAAKKIHNPLCHITVTQGGKSVLFATVRSFEDAMQGFSEASVEFSGLEVIPDYLCDRCSGIKSVRFADGVIGVGVGAFSGCENLEKVEMGDTVSYIDIGAFTRCYALTEFKNGEELRRIESRAFLGCTSLERVELIGKLNYIGHCAFAFCPSLDTFVLRCGTRTLIERDILSNSIVGSVEASTLYKQLRRDLMPDPKGRGVRAATREENRLGFAAKKKSRELCEG